MVRQRWFCWIWVGILAAICTGCQPQGFVTTPSAAVHLTLWQGIGPPSNQAVFQTLVQRFNQHHPQIQVESLYVGHPDQQLPKILTAIVGDAAPDILWYNPTLTGQLVELEAIEPLDNWLAQSPVREQLDPALLETMTFEDHLWSVPLGSNNAAVYYRPSLFQAAGITEPPQTWEAFRQAAKALTQDIDGDGRIDQHGALLSLGKGEWTVFVWLPFVYSAGGWLIQDETPDLVNQGAIAALEFAKTLVKEGSVILSAPERGFEIEPFLTGQVAMQITGPWVLAQMQAAQIDFDVFPLPIAQTPAAIVGGESFFVCRTSPEKRQAAFTFLEYVLGEAFQQDWAIQTGFLPVNSKVQQGKPYQAFMAENPLLQVFLHQMTWARSRPIVPSYAYLSENFGRAVEAVLLGAEPVEALTQAQQRLDLKF